MNYEILEHTADLKIRVYGNNFVDVLKNSAYAVSDLLFPEDIVTDQSYDFEITGEADDQILVKLLNEVVYVLQTKKLLLKLFYIKETKENHYSVHCKGKKINYSDEINYDIKGVTYHDLLIEETGNRLKAEFVIDV